MRVDHHPVDSLPTIITWPLWRWWWRGMVMQPTGSFGRTTDPKHFSRCFKLLANFVKSWKCKLSTSRMCDATTPQTFKKMSAWVERCKPRHTSGLLGYLETLIATWIIFCLTWILEEGFQTQAWSPGQVLVGEAPWELWHLPAVEGAGTRSLASSAASLKLPWYFVRVWYVTHAWRGRKAKIAPLARLLWMYCYHVKKPPVKHFLGLWPKLFEF